MENFYLNSSINDEKCAIESALASLRASKCVILPTETVYGIAANALDDTALANLLAFKHRPPEKPFPLMIRDVEAASEWVTFPTKESRILAEKYWPGPLTIVLPVREDKRPLFRPSTIADDGSLGLRCPAHEVPLALLRSMTAPLAVPSANVSGNPPPKCPADVEALQPNPEQVGTVLIQNSQTDGLPSTIVKIVGDSWKILRQGAILPEQIAEILGTRP